VVSPRNVALAGMIGPAVFALVAVLLTFAQYGFMRDLGWDPLGASDVPWPSGLALGPLGWLQAANFAFFGLTLIVSSRSAWIAPWRQAGGLRGPDRRSWSCPVSP
jgi:hypothetical protein